MKLSIWAKQKGVCYRTAWNYYQKGQIPGAYKLPSGTIIVPDEQVKQKAEYVVTYARISSSENKAGLERQSQRLIDFCNANGWCTHKNIKETGSGLNDSRKKLLEVLTDGKASKLVVEHKDRLATFGIRYIEIICSYMDCELIVLNPGETDKEDLIEDFVSVITSFCAKLFGQHNCKRKTERMIEALQDENNTLK
ncbi:MAG: IS607 family transposase [Gammaproteobacteria bacterium]|nr:IS607 family transposase [Gammaproteobacteria bacterium]